VAARAAATSSTGPVVLGWPPPLRLTSHDGTEVGRGSGQERHGKGLVQQCAVIHAKDRDAGRVNDPVAVAQVGLAPAES
jgi:hypothetical protein